MKTLLLSALLFTCSLSFGQDNRQTKIDEMARQSIATGHQPGLIIGIVDGENQQMHSYGETKKGNRQSPTPQSIFELGEVSSLFTTTLLARMSIAGEVNLDTPLQSLMPQGLHLPVYQKLNCQPIGEGYLLAACDPKSYDETISILLCNLATHTAGFPRNPSNLRKWLHPKNPYARYNQTNLYTYLNQPVGFTSGLDYKYSHVGMALLGHVLSHKAATSYENLLFEKVTDPLQLNDTRVQLNPEQQARLLHGYTAQGKTTPQWQTDIMAPSTGVHSTVTDMLQFLSAHMGVTRQDWIPAMQLAQTPREVIREKELKNSQAALGWLITPMPEINDEMIWYAGQTGGFASYVGFLKHAKVGVVILSNSAAPVEMLGKKMLLTAYSASQKEKVLSPAAIMR